MCFVGRFRVQIIPLLVLPLLLSVSSLRAQDPDIVGAAIAEACQGIPDPSTQSVLAGTVADSVSGVAIPGALVSVRWTEAGEEGDRTSQTKADLNGFFAFCGLPQGVQAEVRAAMKVGGTPVQVVTEPGMLHLVRLTLPFSDPSRPGVLTGRVIDAETREPVEGASVFLWEEEMRTAALTNQHGYFSLGAHPWGIYEIKVTHLAYGTRTAAVRIEGDMTEAVDIALSQTPIELEELVVRSSSRLRSWDMDGLVRRMNAGFGWTVARDRIEKMPSARLEHFVRDIPGVTMHHSGIATSMSFRGKPCTPQIYVDGMIWNFELDFALREFLADELEAVEVFRSSIEIPGEFRRETDPCAVIAIWTRRGGSKGEGKAGK